MDILPDLGSLSDDELKQPKAELEQQEQALGFEPRIQHGAMDILGAELVAGLQPSGGRAVVGQVDVATLNGALAGKSTPEP